MNYLILILTFVFFLFPVKIFSHVGRIMDIVNITVSANSKSKIAFCSLLQSQISENVSFVVCFIQNLNSSQTKEIICKSPTIILSRTNCAETVLKNINAEISSFKSLYLFSNINRTLFLSLQLNSLDPVLRSNDIRVNEKTTALTRDILRILLSVNASIEIKILYKTRCIKNYYGSNCEDFCEPIDNKSGHYKCTKYGKPVCLPGWQGLFCTEAICNECFNGQCIAPGTCKCYHGWMGKACDSCQKAPGCVHGTCNIVAGIPFTCTCKPDWGGQFCDIDLKHCLTHRDLCQNNGTCHNYYGDSRIHYLCKCSPGFSGRHCDILTGDCIYPDCKTKHCLKERQIPKCRCFSGFSGLFCQINNSMDLEFQSVKKNFSSDGLCLSSDEGYSCSCSRYKVKICRCKFKKCPRHSSCIDTNRPDILCSNSSNQFPLLEFSSNFRYDNYSILSSFSNLSETDHNFTKDPYFKFYVGSLVLIPILLGILFVVVIKSTFKFRKKTRVCVKTIHNDLGLTNNIIKPLHFPEQRFLLSQISLSTSFQKDNYLNNFAVSGITSLDNKSLEVKMKPEDTEEGDDFHFCDRMKKNPIVCNPNLLINHYKDIHENVK